MTACPSAIIDTFVTAPLGLRTDRADRSARDSLYSPERCEYGKHGRDLADVTPASRCAIGSIMAFVVVVDKGEDLCTINETLRLPYNLYLSVSRLNSITKRNMSGHVHNTNEACCSIPPVQSEYKPKGSYQKVGSFDKAYVVSLLVLTRPNTSDRHVFPRSATPRPMP